MQTLIRNLRDSSTRVMLARPALWQMETVLVDQAVEKFNLERKDVREMSFMRRPAPSNTCNKVKVTGEEDKWSD